MDLGYRKKEVHRAFIRKKMAWISFFTTFLHILQLWDHSAYHKYLHLKRKLSKYRDSVDVSLLSLQSIAVCAEFPRGEECS